MATHGSLNKERKWGKKYQEPMSTIWIPFFNIKLNHFDNSLEYKSSSSNRVASKPSVMREESDDPYRMSWPFNVMTRPPRALSTAWPAQTSHFLIFVVWTYAACCRLATFKDLYPGKRKNRKFFFLGKRSKQAALLLPAPPAVVILALGNLEVMSFSTLSPVCERDTMKDSGSKSA